VNTEAVQCGAAASAGEAREDWDLRALSDMLGKEASYESLLLCGHALREYPHFC